VADCMRCMRKELPYKTSIPLLEPRYLQPAQKAMSATKLPPLAGSTGSTSGGSTGSTSGGKDESISLLLRRTGCRQDAVRMWCLEGTSEARFFNQTQEYQLYRRARCAMRYSCTAYTQHNLFALVMRIIYSRV
jgi:hypothetical protein